MFLDYDQVVDDLVTLLTAQVTGAEKIGRDLDETDFVFPNYPMIDCRALRVAPELTGQQNYWVDFVIEIEIVAHDLSSRQEAVRLRNGLLNQVQEAVRQNPRFGASNESCILGPVEFATEQTPENGAFVAAAVAQIVVKVYSQQ